MGLLSKLHLFNNNKKIELNLYNVDILDNLPLTDIAQIREFSELSVLLESSENDYFEMPEMDDYYIRNRKEISLNGNYRYLANQKFCLFSFDEAEQQIVPLVPGIYTIRSFIKGKNYYSYFYVIPKDLTTPDWQSIKDEVEQMVSGLSLDFYHRKNSEAVSHESNESDFDISMSKINLFLQSEKKIRFVIESLRQESRYKVGTEHRWEPYGAKNLTDSVTIQKMGERPDKRGMVFSAKRYLDYDVPENRWAKLIINNFISFANQSKIYLESIKIGLNNDRLRTKRYDSVRNDSDVYFQRNRLQTSLESLTDDISKLSKLIFYLQTVLNDEFLDKSGSKVNRTIPKALILSSKYNFLYKLFVLMNKKKNKVVLDHSYEYFWKRTDQLYEIWTYIKSIKALIEIGYEPQEGWIFSKNPHKDVLPRLEPEEAVVFTNDMGNKIRLVFNSELKRNVKSTDERPLLTDSNRNKPDIRMDMFDANNEYAGSILMDAKYKRLKQVLKNQRGEKGIMEQFREYKKDPYVSKGFWHVDEILQNQVMPVQAVIVLYPNDDQTSIRSETIDQKIFIIELNPHQGMDNFVLELSNQIFERYEIFKRFHRSTGSES